MKTHNEIIEEYQEFINMMRTVCRFQQERGTMDAMGVINWEYIENWADSILAIKYFDEADDEAKKGGE